MRIINKAKKLPIKVIFTAPYPSPFNKNLCPGRTLKAVSSSGAPKKILGIKSTKVCVIAIETIKIIRARGEKYCKKNAEEANKSSVIRFTCNPGIKPVMHPAIIPNKIIIKAPVNILCF